MKPNTPNADQLEFIHPKNSPRTNPASYEGEPLPAEELKSQGPTIVLHPSAVYLVDPEAAGERREALKETVSDGGESEEEKLPTLTSLEPNQLPVWAQDTEVKFVGENFTVNSRIIWNGGEEPTGFIDASTLSTIVKPMTVGSPPPVTVQAWVKDGEKETTRLDFTFIA
jgi:hypothetical protein